MVLSDPLAQCRLEVWKDKAISQLTRFLVYCTISTNCSVTHHKGRELELIETLSHVTGGFRRLSDLISRVYMPKSGNCNPNYIVFKVVNSVNK